MALRASRSLELNFRYFEWELMRLALKVKRKTYAMEKGELLGVETKGPTCWQSNLKQQVECLRCQGQGGKEVCFLIKFRDEESLGENFRERIRKL